MAQVRNPDGPLVGASTNPGNDYLQIQANPSAFGAPQAQAGELAAQATSKLGGTLGQVGDQQVQVAQGLQALQNETAARDVSTAYTQKASDLYTKYSTLEGKAAVDAYPQYQKDLEQARQDALSQGTNPALKAMVGNDLSRTSMYYMEAGGRSNAQATKTWMMQSSQARQASSLDQAVQARNDPNAVQTYVNQALAEAHNQAEQKGFDAPTTAEFLKQSQGAAYEKIITALANDAGGGPIKAQTMFDSVRGGLDASSQIKIGEQLRAKVNNYQADSLINDITRRAPAGVMNNVDFDNLWTAQKGQESGGMQFGADGSVLTSSAGAQGVSQIMPDTAKLVAAQHGIPYDPNRVATDAGYNEMLGKTYMQDMLRRYGNPTLALAAYNAGPARVDEWIKNPAIGDPRSGNISNNDFVARIPFQETRNYVTRIATKLAVQDGSAVPQAAYDPDKGMQDALAATTGMDPEVARKVIGGVSSYNSEIRASQAQGRAQLTRDLTQLSAMLEDGAPDAPPIPEARIMATLPPDQAKQVIGDLQTKQMAGQIFTSVANASPEQLQDYQNQLYSGNGIMVSALRGKAGFMTKSDGTLANPADAPGDWTTRRAMANMLTQKIMQRDAALKADPAAYAANNDPTVKAAATALDGSNNSPDAWQAYTTAQRAAQIHLGVPPDQVKLLNGNQVAQLTSTLTKVDPAKADVGQMIDSMSKQYGQDWPAVWGQLVTQGKLPASYQAVAAMDNPAQVSARQDMIRAAQTAAERGGVKKLEEDMPDGTMRDISTAMNDALQPFAASSAIPGLQNNSNQLSALNESVKTLAMYYARDRTTSGTDAVAKAVDGIISQKYDFTGPQGSAGTTMRVPKGMADAVGNATYQAEQALKPADLADPPVMDKSTAADLTPDQRRQNVLNATHVWFTNKNDDGVMMGYQMRDGGVLPMRRADGTPIELKFSDISRNAQAMAAQKATDTAMPPTDSVVP